MRRKIVPTDQTLAANSPPGTPRDTAAATPGVGIRSNVTISVTFQMDTLTGSATVAYEVGAGDVTIYTETDSGATGTQTKTITVSSLDLSVLNLVAKTASAVDPCTCNVLSWFISYPSGGVIADL